MTFIQNPVSDEVTHIASDFQAGLSGVNAAPPREREEKKKKKL